MKKLNIKNVIFIGFAALLISSCATTPKTAPVNGNQDSSEGTETVIDISEEVLDSASEEQITERREAKPLEVKTKTNQQETDFINKLADLDLKLVSSPKLTFQTQAFKSAYVVKAENSSGPVADLDITVSFPSSKTADSVIYDSVQLKTGADGTVTFKPAVPKTAVNDKVTFFPSPVNSTAAMVTKAYELAVTAPWKVKSTMLWYPGLVYVYDFNESGKPGTNSTYLLRDLRNNGVNVGNAPISDTSYYSKSIYQLYKDTYAMVGNSCKFMVYGSVKFAEPVSQDGDKFTCTMEADITCLDMKNGSTLCHFVLTETNTDSNRYKCIDTCKANLCDKAAESIMYGM